MPTAWKHLLDRKCCWTDGATNAFRLKIFVFFFFFLIPYPFWPRSPVCSLKRSDCVTVHVVFGSRWASCSQGRKQARLSKKTNARYVTAHGRDRWPSWAIAGHVAARDFSLGPIQTPLKSPRVFPWNTRNFEAVSSSVAWTVFVQMWTVQWEENAV